MQTHQGIMVILDGLGDRPAEVLGGRTPLEAARTPVMDRLAAGGMTGFVAHLAPGVPVGTQTGCGLLLGLPPAEVGRLSRGLVQAAGTGIALEPGDVALRCNFATLRWGRDRIDILDRRAGRIAGDTPALAAALNGLHLNGVEFLIKASTQHRAALVMRGRGLSERITNTDPGSGFDERGLVLSRPIDAGDEAAAYTAESLNVFLRRAHEILGAHPVNRAREAAGLPPANGLITRGAGRHAVLQNLIRHLRIRTAVVSGEGTLHGLGRLFGFDVVCRPSFTGAAETDLNGKVEAVLEALAGRDLVVLHVKSPDVCAHDRDPHRKTAVIEAIDAALEPIAGAGCVVGITGDHSTDSTTGRHTGDPVPSLVWAPRVRRDRVEGFDESACRDGGLGFVSPMGFLCTMLDQMNRMHNFRQGDLDFFR